MEARIGLMISILLLLSASTPVASVTTTPDPETTVSTTPDPTTTPNPTTTAEPMTTAELTTTAEPTTTGATTTKQSTTIAAATTATTAAPTTEARTTKVVTFTSRLDTFTDDLKDSSTTAFKTRAALLKDQLDPIFEKEFNSSYITMNTVSFSNGSIINIINVIFKSSSAPTTTQLRATLVNAASVVTGFDIDGTSIIIDGTTSSGVSHTVNLVTAAVMVLTSWLLSSHP